MTAKVPSFLVKAPGICLYGPIAGGSTIGGRGSGRRLRLLNSRHVFFIMSRQLSQALCVISGLLFLCARPCGAQLPATPAPAEAKFVSVTGGVREPRRIPWSSDLTLISALTACGGFDWRAPKQVVILRGTERIVVSLRSILKDKEAYPKLQPGDKIEVPQ